MKTFLRILVLITSAGVILAGSKTAPDLPGSSNSPLDVIVQYKTTPTKNELKQLGPYGQIKKQFVHVNAVSVDLTTAQIQTVSQDPNVLYISPNRVTKGSLDITTATVNANIAWSAGYTGTGVGVAVIDSGIYAHADLKTGNGTGSRIVYSESFVPGLDASDQFGHGTHVAGIVGSNGNSSTGPGFTRTLKGVAPNVNLINFRVLDANGAGTDAGVIAAIDEAINLQNTYNIRVINLSLGRPVWESYTLDPLCQAAEAAWKAGIIVVAAAGNFGRDNSMDEHGYGTIVAPGNDPYVITVGAMNDMGTATRTDDTIASYSSKGPTPIDHIVKPDLVAPGNGTVSLMSPNSTLSFNSSTVVPNSYYQTKGGGNSSTYMRLSGTSMATPVVSGAAALLLQQNPSLTPDQVKARLMKTAQKVLTLYNTSYDRFTMAAFHMQSDIFEVGAGYLDIQAAISNHDLTSLPALSATAVYNSVTHLVTITRNLSSSWGASVFWSDSLVYGFAVLSGQDGDGFSVVWGDSVIWGLDDGGGGFSVVWGDSVLLPMSIQALDSGDGDYSVVWGD
ncbi:MAG TPA: S8 family peptidase [Bryobacteraceae bacterium]|jgi:serine protease AprX|nr:S8 family peptidase [Bryobacteraceae bacterium]